MTNEEISISEEIYQNVISQDDDEMLLLPLLSDEMPHFRGIKLQDQALEFALGTNFFPKAVARKH